MTRRRRVGARTAPAALAVVLVTAGLLVSGVSSPSAKPHVVAAAAPYVPTYGGDLGFEPVIGLPATGVVVFGSSPAEASSEAWAYGQVGSAAATTAGGPVSNTSVLLQQQTDGIWSPLALPQAPGGGSLPSPAAYGADAGQSTTEGGVVLLAGQHVVIRDPGGQPQLAPDPAPISSGASATGVLGPSESLVNPHPGSVITIPYAPIDGAGGHTGVLIAPYQIVQTANGPGPGVLHYDGQSQQWTREPIQVPAGQQQGFTVLALGCGPAPAATGTPADSDQNCWLLAQSGSGSGTTLSLYRRDDGQQQWDPVSADDWLLGSAPDPAGVGSAAAGPLGQGAQMLTVTAQGAWVDFAATINGTPTDVTELVEIPQSAGGAGHVVGRWCYPTTAGCPQSLGAALPAAYRSFAWPGASTGDPGTRVISGLPGRALLEFDGSEFQPTSAPGGTPGPAPGAAAMNTPTQGWIADGSSATSGGGGSTGAGDNEGSPQVIDVTPDPATDPLGDQTVPATSPLLAIAAEPGTSPGESGGSVVAVGENGEIIRYTPGAGWSSDELIAASSPYAPPIDLREAYGKRPSPTRTSVATAAALPVDPNQTRTTASTTTTSTTTTTATTPISTEVVEPDVRGVAWPAKDLAYAVGDDGGLWQWTTQSSLWLPDVEVPPGLNANLNGIAFSAIEPSIGEIAGQDGTLLSYDGNTSERWSQDTLPAALKGADFTSVTFAGGTVLATYRITSGTTVTGGLVENNGSGWMIDPGAARALPPGAILDRVAGLEDGGAVAAGPGVVIEVSDEARDSWALSPEPIGASPDIAAVAAFRNPAGKIRAMVSVDLDGNLTAPLSGTSSQTGTANATGVPVPPGPIRTTTTTATTPTPTSPTVASDPLPASGYLLTQTDDGWSDVEHDTWPESAPDGPQRPDPVLAIAASGDGQSGVTAGGQTGDYNGTTTAQAGGQTAAVMAFGGTLQSVRGTQDYPANLDLPTVTDNLIVGGGADCLTACADLSEAGATPDASLFHAVALARLGSAVQAFIYTGGRIQSPADVTLTDQQRTAELTDQAAALQAGSGRTMPVIAATSPDERSPTTGSAPFDATVGQVATGADGHSYYAERVTEGHGPVEVIVLDFSSGSLGATQTAWLEEELEDAHNDDVPAIVVGSDALDFSLPGDSDAVEAHDASEVSQILVDGGASAYLFDYPGGNIESALPDGVPAIGTGTLGYVPPQSPTPSTAVNDVVGISVGTDDRDSQSNIAPVEVFGIPNISSLSIDNPSGPKLGVDEVVEFSGLARRASQGSGFAQEQGQNTFIGPAPYDELPNNCNDANCGYAIGSLYGFTSSDPSVGDFVENLPGATPDRVPDQGTFCARSAGTTTITLTAGGLTTSVPVTVSGKAEGPDTNCGLSITDPTSTSTTPTTPAPTNGPGPAPVKTPAATPTTHKSITSSLQRPTHSPAPHGGGTSGPFANLAHQPPPKLQPTVPPVPLHVFTPNLAHNISPPTPPQGGAGAHVPSQGQSPAGSQAPTPGASQVSSPVAQNVAATERARESSPAVQSVHNAVAVRPAPAPAPRHPAGAPPVIAVRHGTGSPLPVLAWTIPLVLLALAGSAAALRDLPRRRSRYARAYVRRD